MNSSPSAYHFKRILSKNDLVTRSNLSWDFTFFYKAAVRTNACDVCRIWDGFWHLLGVCKWISKRREEKMYPKLPFRNLREWGCLPFLGILRLFSSLPSSHTGVRVCVCVFHCIWLFCDPVDCSWPGSSVRGILQARILEWVPVSFSRGSSRPRDGTCVSCFGRWILYHWASREALWAI